MQFHQGFNQSAVGAWLNLLSIAHNGEIIHKEIKMDESASKK